MRPVSPPPNTLVKQGSIATYRVFVCSHSSHRNEGNNDPVSIVAERFQQVKGFLFGGILSKFGQEWLFCQVVLCLTIPSGRLFLNSCESMVTMRLLSAQASRNLAVPVSVATYKRRAADTLKKVLAIWIQGAKTFHRTGLSTLQVSVSDKPGMSCPANPSLIGLSTLYHLSCAHIHKVNNCPWPRCL